MLDAVDVIVTFKASPWLVKQLDRLCDHRSAANPKAGRITRDMLLHELVLGHVTKNLMRTPSGGVRLRRPPPKIADATGCTSNRVLRS